MRSFTIQIKRTAKAVAVAAFWLAVWQLLYITVNSEVLIPSPVHVMKTWAGFAASKKFWLACFYSLARVACGFAAAFIAGLALGTACSYIKVFNTLISPVMHIVRSTPVISFIILALVWIKTDFVPVFISFLTVTPIIYGAVRGGFSAVDGKLLEMAKVFGMKKTAVFRNIYLPALSPALISQGTVGMGFAWKSGIAAEVICLPLVSIGKELKRAKSLIDTPAVFAWTATVILLSLLLERMLKAVTRRFAKRWAKW